MCYGAIAIVARAYQLQRIVGGFRLQDVSSLLHDLLNIKIYIFPIWETHYLGNLWDIFCIFWGFLKLIQVLQLHPSKYHPVGGFKHVLFSMIYGIILPIDFHIFQDGWNHQPVPTSHSLRWVENTKQKKTWHMMQLMHTDNRVSSLASPLWDSD